MKKTGIAAIVALLSCMIACGGENTAGSGTETPLVLTAPDGISLTEVPGQTSLAFKWNAVTGAQSYSYRLLKGSTQDRSGDCAETSVRFDDLVPGTSYKFDVQAVAGTRRSTWSSRFEASTAAAEVTPGPVPEPEPIVGGDMYDKFLIPAAEEDGKVRAFPGAEGGGMYTTGGRDGKIYHVTNLDNSGEGSLRYGIERFERPCVIVFDVAGTIALESRLEIKKGDITIAGQTAPGDGICLKNYNFRINASNVIIRFIRGRMGDEKGTEDDAMNCYANSGLENIIVDHCSMSWSTDECGSFYGIKNFTLQYCILSESLRISVHDKGKHGYGGIWGGENASYHHNLIAHHDSRNPRFDHDYVSTLKGPIHFVNNVVYNWGANSGYGGESGPGTAAKQINMVYNYYKPGPASTPKTRIVNPTTKCSNCNKTDQYNIVPGLFYVDGNFMYGSEAVTADNWQGVDPDDKTLKDKVKAASYMGSHTGTVHSPADALTSVLAYSGASLSRDRVDTRVTGEVRNGNYTYKGSNGSTNGLIDTQSDVGGWPTLTASSEQTAIAATDSDKDGIPDYYETMFGLDKTNPADAAAKTLDKNGRYSNLEMYLHWLVKDIVKGENSNGSYRELK